MGEKMAIEPDDWINHEEDEIEVEEPKDEPGFCKKAITCFCRLKQKKAVKLTPEEEAELKKQFTDTTEEPFWRNFVNAKAINRCVHTDTLVR
ncbi:hypothetical protein ATANTOWER_016957 [Ataeniobius toweri]|uniref:Uncharacterized protein n=1 Tax=Ataeniobius toweri TaxID=208326 RepID=A0ABU7AQZ8_9TELE|nr:hypothetical protein [Ataeniobius toweri]